MEDPNKQTPTIESPQTPDNPVSNPGIVTPTNQTNTQSATVSSFATDKNMAQGAAKRKVAPLYIAGSLIVVLLLAVGLYFLVFHKSSKPPTTQVAAGTVNSSATNSANQCKGLNTFTSSVGGFTFKYPCSWVFAYQDSNLNYQKSNPTPSTTTLSLLSQSPNVTKNNFNVSISITLGGGTFNSDYSTSSVQKLTNGLDVVTLQYTNGQASEMDVIAGQSGKGPFSAFQLPNGHYLGVSAAFMTGASNVVSYSSEAQLSTPEWKDAQAIIASIKYQ